MNTFAPTASRIRRRAGVLIAAATLLALTACGGGVYVEGEVDGPPPAISLTTSVTDAQPGEVIQLAAAVTASNGIDYVDFYRIDSTRDVVLGGVTRPPARWDTTIPTNAGDSVRYYARVCDLAGYCTDSRVQTVYVYR